MKSSATGPCGPIMSNWQTFTCFHSAVHANQCARPTLSHPLVFHGMDDSFPFGAGRYPVSSQPAVSSAASSPPRANAAAALRTPPAGRTSISTFRTSLSRPRDGGRPPPSPCPPLIPQDRDDLLIVAPGSLHYRPSPWRRTLPANGHISAEQVTSEISAIHG